MKAALTVRVSSEVKALIENLAKAEGRSTGQYVERLLTKHSREAALP
ncbi:ribbon-helix-helix protein, CopG family [Novosphingobium sp. TCA1]|nr:ribbon-helix-helix protein, CopG family [Novosphingobium sp. TCA1]GFE77710.1 hypothetical protein NTCA1_53590 [Novosphingobium sp. TCA1]